MITNQKISFWKIPNCSFLDLSSKERMDINYITNLVFKTKEEALEYGYNWLKENRDKLNCYNVLYQINKEGLKLVSDLQRINTYCEDIQVKPSISNCTISKLENCVRASCTVKYRKKIKLEPKTIIGPDNKEYLQKESDVTYTEWKDLRVISNTGADFNYLMIFELNATQQKIDLNWYEKESKEDDKKVLE